MIRKSKLSVKTIQTHPYPTFWTSLAVHVAAIYKKLNQFPFNAVTDFHAPKVCICFIEFYKYPLPNGSFPTAELVPQFKSKSHPGTCAIQIKELRGATAPNPSEKALKTLNGGPTPSICLLWHVKGLKKPWIRREARGPTILVFCCRLRSEGFSCFSRMWNYYWGLCGEWKFGCRIIDGSNRINN